MRLRALSVLLAVAIPGLVIFGLVGAVSHAGPVVPGGEQAALVRCAKVVLGGTRSAAPLWGRTDPTVVSEFSVFRRTRSRGDALPAAAGLRQALASAGAASYDPSRSVLLTREKAHSTLYAVPANIAAPELPAGCAQLPGAAGYLALRSDQAGSGHGVCLIPTALVRITPPILSQLPGAAAKPTKKRVAVGAVCESTAVLAGYFGALGSPLVGPPLDVALIPDGVTSITYTLASGKQFTASVTGNLAPIPAGLMGTPSVDNLPVQQLGRQIAASLPVTVTETGANSQPLATLSPPAGLAADLAGSFSFFKRLPSQSSGGTDSVDAWCSTRTHRCVAVIVTTACDSRESCQIRRVIRRYRYVGSKPPVGTTGPNLLDTAPVRARINQLVQQPRKLTLVLRGPRQPYVGVLLEVTCFRRHSSASDGGPPLYVAVPTRTPISLPGPARSFRACAINALITSTRPYPVHVNLARG